MGHVSTPLFPRQNFAGCLVLGLYDVQVTTEGEILGEALASSVSVFCDLYKHYNGIETFQQLWPSAS